MVSKRNPHSLKVGWTARRTIEFAVVEAYPLEVGGIIIHDEDSLIGAASFTKYVARSGDSITAYAESSERAEEIFGDILFGKFHSHPGAPTSLSKDDFYAMEDDNIEWVVSVWPGKRKWCFRHRIYSKHEGKIRIVPTTWLSLTDQILQLAPRRT